MTNTRILEMLNAGEIESLKAALSEEIYAASLKESNNKTRYSAMKRFVKYSEPIIGRELLKNPCRGIEFNGKIFNSFLDTPCAVLTTEDIGEIPEFDKNKGVYPDMAKIFNQFQTSDVNIVDFNPIIAEAKSKGYKFKKSAFKLSGEMFLLEYGNRIYNFGLFDKAFSVINDGKQVNVYNTKTALIIETSIGYAIILSLRLDNKFVEKSRQSGKIIKVEI